MTVATESHNPLASLTFPRTGKRGVPQQFPRRLYEMLDSETKLVDGSTDHPKVITWSDSGKAFRIFDASEFANTVLPKYFRTKKFSSFQRNLNLYGFTKVRRGPETDMYAHPSFLRDNPASLLNLRKISNDNRRRTVSKDCSSWESRTISPSPPASVGSSSSSPITPSKSVSAPISLWAHLSKTMFAPIPDEGLVPKISYEDRGKLDLLALALEHESELR